jgi:hypothetical protein
MILHGACREYGGPCCALGSYIAACAEPVRVAACPPSCVEWFVPALVDCGYRATRAIGNRLN